MNAKEIEAFARVLDEPMKRLESEVMADIIRRIKINGEITRAADWQIYRLHELGMSKKAIKKYIKEALKLSPQEINHLFKDVIRKGYAEDEQLYKYKGKPYIPFEENTQLQQLITATAQQTYNEMKNITQSLGFAVRQPDNTLKFTKLADYYQQTLDKATLSIATGTFDYNTVLKKAVAELTNSGLRTVNYETGWSNRVEVAIRRAVMTGIGQITGKISEQNAEILGTDTFEVTWHGGARPSHQKWQGKWYTMEQLKSICGYGTVTGLKGANCYHDFYPVIPDVDEPTYTEEQLAKMNEEENTPVEYKGKKYTKYEALQRQRKLETTMRAQRQKIKLLQEGGVDEEDIIIARGNYRVTSSEYASFSEAMNLPQQRERVTLDGLGDIGQEKYKLPENNMSKPKVYKGKVWKSTGTKITEQQYNGLIKHAKDKGIKLVSFQNFDGDVSLIHDMIDNADKVIQDFPLLAKGKTQLQIHNSFNLGDDDFAQTIGNKIFINNFAFRDKELLIKEYSKLEKENWFVKGTDYNSIIFHEAGHAVANVYGLSPMKIAKEVTGFKYEVDVLEYCAQNLSQYSGIKKGAEIISEAFSSVYSINSNNKFALKYYTECVKIILKRGGI